jgi:hypothetical protein
MRNKTEQPVHFQMKVFVERGTVLTQRNVSDATEIQGVESQKKSPWEKN